jgi:hypothetical protein
MNGFSQREAEGGVGITCSREIFWMTWRWALRRQREAALTVVYGRSVHTSAHVFSLLSDLRESRYSHS